MPQTGPVAYASVGELFGNTGYLRDPASGPNAAIGATLLNAASRFIDEKCGRFFYADGFYERSFDGTADREITLPYDFYGKIGTIAPCAVGATTLTYTPAAVGGGPPPAIGDVFALDIGLPYEQVTVQSVTGAAAPYGLNLTAPTRFAHTPSITAAVIATTMVMNFLFYENQPRFLNGVAQWLIVPGDGVSPGSTNYMLWPSGPKPYIATGYTASAPWVGFNLPQIPVSNTTYLPTPRPGSRTIVIGANWGWPVVPDAIKDLTLKLAARAWQHREAAWSGSENATGVNMSHHFDSKDEHLLIESGYVRPAI